ncbi:MAG: hypothetical protein DDT41_01173 [candidate division WS2 bacterium]|nr:hypothetical protein [Candidatus Psychracetigena formicireducens]
MIDKTNTIHYRLENNPVNFIKEIVAYTKQALYKRHDAWARYRVKARNRWYKTEDKPIDFMFSTNHIYRKMETGVSLMSQRLPVPTILGVEKADDDAAVLKQGIVDWMIGDKQCNWEIVGEQLAYETLLTGLSFIKVVFDPSMNKGDGGVRWYALPPETVLIDPLAINMDTARWVIHERQNVPIEEVYALTGKYPSPGSTLGFLNEDKGKPYEQKQGEIGMTTTRWECFIRVLDPKERTKEEAMTPKWKLYIVYNGLENPIYSGDLYYDHGELPIIPLPSYQLATTLYAPGIVEAIEPLQDYIDVLDSMIFINLSNIVSRQRIIRTGCGLNAADIDDDAGRVWELTDINAMRWDNPPPLPQDVYIMKRDVEVSIDKVSGIHDVAEGRTQAGVEAYSAIAQLIEQSTKNIRRINKNMARAVSAATSQTLELYKQYLGPELFTRVAGESVYILTEYPDFLAIKSPDGEYINTPKGRATPDNKKAWKEENGIKLVLEDIDPRYDIMVSADNDMPTSRAQRARIALDLFALQESPNAVIDREALLEAIDFPGRLEIMRRTKEKEMLLAQQAGLMGGMPIGASPRQEQHAVPPLQEITPGAQASIERE